MTIRCPHCGRDNELSLEPQSTPHPRCLYCGEDMSPKARRLSEDAGELVDKAWSGVHRLTGSGERR